MPGLLQTFDVSSDTLEQLEMVVPLVFTWHKRGAINYRVGETKGSSWIELGFNGSADKWTMLPFPLDTPAKIYVFLRDWLSSAKRGPEFDTDGSCNRGWRVTQSQSVWEPVLIRCEATWIIYGK